MTWGAGAHGEWVVDSPDERMPPPRDPESSSDAEPAIQPALRRQYAHWLFTSQVYSVFGGLVAAVVWWMLLLWVQEVRLALLPEPRHVFAPAHPAYTAALAFFAGIPTAEAVRLLVVRIRFGDWIPALRAESRKGQVSAGLNSGLWSWVRDMVLVAGAAVLLLNWYTVFGQEEIRIHRLFRLKPEIHRYADITALRTNRNPEHRGQSDAEPPHLQITFQDGAEWTTATLPWPQPDFAAVRTLQIYLTRRSGIAPGEPSPPTAAADQN